MLWGQLNQANALDPAAKALQGHQGHSLQQAPAPKVSSTAEEVQILATAATAPLPAPAAGYETVQQACELCTCALAYGNEVTFLLHVCTLCCFRKHFHLYITTDCTALPVLQDVSAASYAAQLFQWLHRNVQAMQTRQGDHVQQQVPAPKAGSTAGGVQVLANAATAPKAAPLLAAAAVQQGTHIQPSVISASDRQVRHAQQMPFDCFEALLHLAVTPGGRCAAVAWLSVSCPL